MVPRKLVPRRFSASGFEAVVLLQDPQRLMQTSGRIVHVLKPSAPARTRRAPAQQVRYSLPKVYTKIVEGMQWAKAHFFIAVTHARLKKAGNCR